MQIVKAKTEFLQSIYVLNCFDVYLASFRGVLEASGSCFRPVRSVGGDSKKALRDAGKSELP